jgi:hypothetical protein
MEYIDQIDKGFDILLKYDILYFFIIFILIIIVATPDGLDLITFNMPMLNFSNGHVENKKILIILFIAYLSNKDLRISILCSLLFLIYYEKHNIDKINKEILFLHINNKLLEQDLEQSKQKN